MGDKLFSHEEIGAGKRHALIGMVKAHPASVKVILLLFSDRENLLLLTLGWAPTAQQAGPASLLCARCAALQPLCAAWARVLRLLCGRRCRSKIRVLIV